LADVPKQVNWLSPVFAGAFFAGAAFSALIGLAILPFTLIGLIVLIGVLGFLPFLTAFVYLRAGVRALRTPLADVAGGTRLAAAVFGAVVAIAIPHLAGTLYESAVSSSVQTLISGNPAEAEAAAQRLKRLRVVPTKFRNQMAGAYGNEFNPIKKEILKRAYQDITGEDLELRHLILLD
jgi:hypothetical protein